MGISVGVTVGAAVEVGVGAAVDVAAEDYTEGFEELDEDDGELPF